MKYPDENAELYDEEELKTLSDQVSEENKEDGMEDYEGQVYIFYDGSYHHDEVDPTKSTYEHDGKEYKLRNPMAFEWDYRLARFWWLKKQDVAVWFFVSDSEEPLTHSKARDEQKFTKLKPADMKIIVDQNLEDKFVKGLISSEGWPLNRRTTIILIVAVVAIAVLWQTGYLSGLTGTAGP